MIKFLLLTWSILANTFGAHSIATKIEQPLVQHTQASAEVSPSTTASIIAQLPIPQTLIGLKTTAKPDIQAYAYLAYDANTATVLVEKNGFTSRAEASTAKLMTALLVDEINTPNDQVTVSHAAAFHQGSIMGLREGEVISTRNLLYGLLLTSGNDAAQALAEHYGGMDAFVTLMNTRAGQLGLSESHFADPAGFDEDNTVLSPFDLAKLMKVTLGHPNLTSIMMTKDIVVSDQSGKIQHQLTTSDRLVKNDFPGILGGKTGTGTFDKAKAGHVLVAADERSGHRIITVVSNTYFNTADASANETTKLINFVFDNIQ